MKAQRYAIKVADTLDQIESGGYEIEEYYIPSAQIFINANGMFSLPDPKMRIEAAGPASDVELSVKASKLIEDISKLNEQQARLYGELREELGLIAKTEKDETIGDKNAE